MTDRRSSQPAGRCPVEERLLGAWLEDASSLEGEVFAAHAASCPDCSRRVELANDLKKATAPLLSPLPETAPPPAEVRALRRAARSERKPGSRRKALTASGLKPSPLWMAAAATVILTAAVFLIIRPGSREITRGQTAALEETMSPRGALRVPPGGFQWGPVPGAARYSIELIDENLELLLSEKNLSELKLVLPEEIRIGLDRGKTYVWTVIALDEHYSVIEEISASFSLE